jgi:Tfp pilus assembly protein PilW
MSPFKKPNRGMTLVEILIAASLALIVVTGGLRFVIQTLKSYQYETGKLLVNRDIRQFTAQMIDDATYANSFMIFDQTSNLSRATGYTKVDSDDPLSANYKGYTTALTTTEADDDATPKVVGTARVESGLPGDVVVFVYHVGGDNAKIYQLIIYYRLIATTANGTDGTNSTDANVATRTKPLRRIKVSITDATAQTYGIMRLLPDLTKVTAPNNAAGVPVTVNANNSTIFGFVDGQAHDDPLSPSTNRKNKMFYNMNSTSVLIRGRIYENYTAQRLVKSTYNFTVTPRG